MYGVYPASWLREILLATEGGDHISRPPGWVANGSQLRSSQKGYMINNNTDLSYELMFFYIMIDNRLPSDLTNSGWYYR